MSSSSDPHPVRRFPRPWQIEQTQHGFIIRDANKIAIAHVYQRDDLHKRRFNDYRTHLSLDEARRIAKAISRIPEFMAARNGDPSPRYRVEQWSPETRTTMHVITQSAKMQNAALAFERAVRSHPYAHIRLLEDGREVKRYTPPDQWSDQR